MKEWTKLDIAGASQLATDRERWRKIIKVTAAQIAPPDQREREGEREGGRERETEREETVHSIVNKIAWALPNKNHKYLNKLLFNNKINKYM